MLQVFEATILVIICLVFTSIILSETKEEKEIRRLFNRIVFVVYVINIVAYFIISTK